MATETLTTASSSPWATPAYAKNLVIECWGAGGAGGGNSTSADGGGGGGGGAYSKKTIAAPSGNYNFDVGAGGTGSAGADGGNGEDTWFVSNDLNGCVAKGGVGGKAPVGGAGGVAGSGGLASAGYGDTKFDGGWGTTGRDSSTGRGGGGASSAGTGADGANDGSAGDYATYTMTGRTGPTGSGPGGDGGGAGVAGSAPGSGNGGGGGGSGDTAGSALAGGGGAAGKIVLTWDIKVFADIRQDIINGLDSAQSEANGWDAEVKAKIPVTDVVRTSNTVVTVTLSAESGYNITAQETITVTVPASAVAGDSQIVASPTFTVDFVEAGAVPLPAFMADYRRRRN